MVLKLCKVLSWFVNVLQAMGDYRNGGQVIVKLVIVMLTNGNVRICMYICMYLCVCLYVSLYVCMYVCMHVHHACMRVLTCTCVHVYVHVCVRCVSVSIMCTSSAFIEWVKFWSGSPAPTSESSGEQNYIRWALKSLF